MDPRSSIANAAAESPAESVTPLQAAEAATLRLDSLLEERLRRLAEVAPLEDPRLLREFLPACEPEFAPLLLVELVKLDMAAAAEQGREACLDVYLGALPDLLRADRVPFDLVIEEYQLRREGGHEPRQAEYALRFPQHAELLGRFSCEAVTVAPTNSKPACPREFTPGEVLDDFQVVQPLGRGAFARVYLARQVSMQRLVALKVSAGKGDEPRALAQFDHPNIVRVYDQRAIDGGRTHLLYMQYLPGGTLHDVARRVAWGGVATGNGLLEAVDDNLLDAAQLPPEDSPQRAWLAKAPWPVVVAWLGVQLARALDEAHRRGVLHRDVKPANVLLTAEGIPKLADFNVSFAGAAGRAGAAATLGGSIGYMAPEHLAAIGGRPGTSPADVGERADLYSLGVLLWELWQGRRPFRVEKSADSWTDALAQQMVSREAGLVEPAPSGHVSERALERTLREALRNDPAERLASGAELASRLQLALHPEAAEVFDPPASGWRGRTLGAPAVAVVALMVLAPNIAAGRFNYIYNKREIIQEHSEMPHFSELMRFFDNLSCVVNGVAFPLGAALAVYYGWPVTRWVWRAKRGEGATAAEVDALFHLCHRGALLGGALWGVSSLVFPLAMSWRFPAFKEDESLHFCLSLLVCGGVAAVYPYFLLVTTVVAVYYPQLVRRSLCDPKHDRRGDLLREHGELYLFAAAVIPLAGIVLLVSRETMARDMILWGVVATVLGLFAAFRAYRYVLAVWERMAPVLSERKRLASPGAGGA